MIVYNTGQLSSRVVTAALGEGLGWPVVAPPWDHPLVGPAAFYGRLRGTHAIRRQCEADGCDWFMADNGYIGGWRPKRKAEESSEIDPDRFVGYYKLSRNGYQCDGRGSPDETRLARVLDSTGSQIKPWQKPGRHILICPTYHDYDLNMSFWGKRWLKIVGTEIRKVSSLPMRVRYRPGDYRENKKPRSLDADLTNCHAVVTHDSNVVVEALLAGVPAFVTGDSPAAVLGNVDIANIMSPRRGDREEWLAILAANQWTLDEIRDGMANETLGLT